MLQISPDIVCFIILKAHAFDAKDDMVEPATGSNPPDDKEDADYAELKAAIDGLNEDEQIDLVALTWLGRGDFTKDEWAQARQTARDARSDHTAAYLLGIPLLGEYLEEGLSQLDYSCEDYEMGHL
jgi:hypothetical protein